MPIVALSQRATENTEVAQRKPKSEQPRVNALSALRNLCHNRPIVLHWKGSNVLLNAQTVAGFVAMFTTGYGGPRAGISGKRFNHRRPICGRRGEVRTGATIRSGS